MVIRVQAVKMITDNYRSKLHENLAGHFSEDELRSLCFELEIDYEDLPAQGKAGKARELIIYLERVQRVDELIERCQRLRPRFEWGNTPGIPSLTVVQSAAHLPQPPSIVNTNPYHSSSPLPPNSPLYIERHADHQAWSNLQRMEYVMFVEPRQQGKTSLIHRLALRCKGYDYVFAYLDLVHFDTSTQKNWYGALYQELLRIIAPVIAGYSLPQPTNSGTWFSFLRELAQIASSSRRRLVIALDEVGAIPPGKWATDFFATIRSIFMHRGSMECFSYLTFIISGAQDPRDMISDPRISDFSFARVPIADLGCDQVKGLLRHLCAADGIEDVANRLYYWTGGQPYLCQTLCGYLAEAGCVLDTKAVDDTIETFFLGNHTHLQDLLDDLKARPDLVENLCRILAKPTKFAPALNREHFRLAHVIGILASDQPYCQVRNRIYQRALDEDGLCSGSAFGGAQAI